MKETLGQHEYMVCQPQSTAKLDSHLDLPGRHLTYVAYIRNASNSATYPDKKDKQSNRDVDTSTTQYLLLRTTYSSPYCSTRQIERVLDQLRVETGRSGVTNVSKHAQLYGQVRGMRMRMSLILIQSDDTELRERREVGIEGKVVNRCEGRRRYGKMNGAGFHSERWQRPKNKSYMGSNE